MQAQALGHIATWLRRRDDRDRSILMPLKEDDAKCPKYPHKPPASWEWEDVDRFTSDHPTWSAWGILLDRLCVVDADDLEAVNWLERLGESGEIPELRRCAVQETRRGRHYMFARPTIADDMGFYDGARQVGRKGLSYNVDLKTLCSTGTRGLVSIAPSVNKRWLEGRAPWVLVDLPMIPESLLALVAAPRSRGRALPPIERPLGSMDPLVIRCLSMLEPARWDDYGTWMRLCYLLRNVGHGDLYKDTFYRFSSKSIKFNADACERMWTNGGTGINGVCDQTPIGLGTLFFWAREDAPDEYAEIRADLMHSQWRDVDVADMRPEQLVTAVQSCDGTAGSVAQIVVKLLRGRYVCVSEKNKVWYCFDGSRWINEGGAINLRRELSTTVRDLFKSTLCSLSRLNHDVMDTSSSSSSLGSGKSKTELAVHGICKTMMKRLNDPSFKDSVMKELNELLFDPQFIEKLDTNRWLLGFNNGVLDLSTGEFRKARPSDHMSLSVGFDHVSSDRDRDFDTELIRTYWTTLHPDPDQRMYVMKMFSRQLNGDDCMNLFHVHTGKSASAANGKSKFFEILGWCCGSYVTKFGVEHIVASKRPEPGKPMPVYEHWRGRRILYCTEPNDNDRINSGILKDMTGGEEVNYRMLFDNGVKSYRPQYKLHIMCNDTPNIDGRDAGVQRRVRKIDYISQFVPSTQACLSEHKYPIVPHLSSAFSDPLTRMAFLRSLLSVYEHGWEFPMPAVIQSSSETYLEENNVVCQFVRDHVKAGDSQTFFTVGEAKRIVFDVYQKKVKTLKSDLERILGQACIDQHWGHGKNNRFVFIGWGLISTPLE